jgi:serine/threonine protein kinase
MYARGHAAAGAARTAARSGAVVSVVARSSVVPLRLPPIERECGGLLGPYQLLFPLHQGGMGAVWCAREVASGAKVAVKFPRTELESPEVLACFEREAAIAAEIWGDNVVRLRAFGYAGQSPFIAMDFVEGGSCAALADWAWGNGAGLAPALVARVGLDIANALWSVHALVEHDGTVTPVVHRDISPQNVMIDANARAHLVDFGIASTVTAIRDEATMARAIGKIRYMAPEQALGGHYDQRADVWALGATLFVLLTGRPPFDGVRDIDVALLLAEPGAPHRWPQHRQIDPRLRAVVDRCLEKDPSRRFLDAKDVAFALEPLAWPPDSPEHADLRSGISVFLNGCVDEQRQKLVKALGRMGRRPTPALGFRAVRMDFQEELGPTSCFVRVVNDLPRELAPELPAVETHADVVAAHDVARARAPEAPAPPARPPALPEARAPLPTPPRELDGTEARAPSSERGAPTSTSSSATVRVPRPGGEHRWSIRDTVLLLVLMVAAAIVAFTVTNPRGAEAYGKRAVAAGREGARRVLERLP